MRRVATSPQAGSAYLIVLLVLVVLTIVGLSLVAITQTEMQIGSNERVTNRTFYSADAGIGVATARVLVTQDHSARSFLLPDSDSPAAVKLGETVSVSPFYPILDAPCNLCTINQGNDYYQINHALTVRAARRSWGVSEDGPSATSPQLSQQTVAVMIELQPWQLTAESFQALDTDQLTSIEY
jgi:Tfp pilus assembly protein PilX